MSQKNQKRALDGVFKNPVRPMPMHRFRSLLVARGAVLTECEGSRFLAVLNGARATFHTPHPGNEAGKGMVRRLRQFLENAEIQCPA